MHKLLSLADGESRDLWQNLRLGYTESAGHPMLRTEIASLYPGVEAHEILVCAGAEEAIHVSMCAMLSAGDHIVAAWPAYQSLYEIARAVGAEVTLVPLDPVDWSLNPDAVRRALRPNTRAIVINYPHSPTGALLTRDVFQALCDIAGDSGIRLFSDEVYRFLEFDEAARLPAAVQVHPRAVSIGVMSKSFALPGLRIGWVATRDRDLLARVAAQKDYTTICNSAPAEILALIALRARDEVLARSRELIVGNLSVLDRFFERTGPRVRWVRPRAGSVAFPEIPGVDVDGFTSDLIERHGVLLLPGSQFGYPGSHFRIGFGRRDMPEALARLEEFLTGHYGV